MKGHQSGTDTVHTSFCDFSMEKCSSHTDRSYSSFVHCMQVACLSVRSVIPPTSFDMDSACCCRSLCPVYPDDIPSAHGDQWHSHICVKKDNMLLYATAILTIIEGQFQAFQRFCSSKLVLKAVESCFTALNYYENGSTCGWDRILRKNPLH